MTENDILYPVKRFEVQNIWSDSATWNDFQFRQGDIIINTFSKSGTTWMQQIVCQLIFDGKENINVSKISPWLESCLPPEGFESKEQLLQTLEEQTHRRFIKSHLPLGAHVFSPKVKYIIVGRDGRDVICSLYNHLVNFIHESHVKTESIHEIFQSRIFDKSETSFFAHVRSWWNVRHLPNVLLVHFYQLKNNLPFQIQRIAKFLEIEIDPLQWNAILEHCSFNYMKGNAGNFVDNKCFVGGATTFFCQGTNERWKNILTKEECDTYEKRAIEELGEEGARWLSTGQLPDEKETHSSVKTVLSRAAICISFLSCNVSPHIKRATELAFMIFVSNIGGVIGGQIYRSQDAPRFIFGHSINLISCILSFISAAFLVICLYLQNQRRDRLYGKVATYTATNVDRNTVGIISFGSDEDRQRWSYENVSEKTIRNLGDKHAAWRYIV